MNQKHIGIILLIVGVILAGVVFAVKHNDDVRIKEIINETGSCYLTDGTCLHEDRDYSAYIIGWVLSAAILILGVYLILFDKTQETLAKHQIKVSSALKEARIHENHDSKFKAFLSGFKEDEQKVISAINDQDGIKQSTLRYKTGMSKTTLSLMLKDLEKREIISRKEDGKTNQVFLRKKF